MTNRQYQVKKRQRGGVLLETALVSVIFVALIAIVIDLRTMLNESSAIKEASRFATRVAAGASHVYFSASILQEYTLIAAKNSLTSNGLNPDDYYIEIWGISETHDGNEENLVQVTVSRKGEDRFWLLPKSFGRTCAGTTMFMESRFSIEPTAIAKQNPACNPGGA